ncbi:MAG: YncE family protein, partial [Nitrospirota bacterium]
MNIKKTIFLIIIAVTAPSFAQAKGLYVVNESGTINFIDTLSEIVVKEIPSGSSSINIAADPSNRYIVIGNGEENEKVWVLDIQNERIVAKIPVMMGKRAGFFFFAFSKDGSRLFVLNRYSSELYVISVDDWRLIKTIPLNLTPEGMAISSDSRFLYIINRAFPALIIFNLDTEKVEKSANMEGAFSSIINSPDGKVLYVADKSASKILVIDAATFEVLKDIVTGTEPVDMAITKDGRFLYASCRFSYSLIVIDPVEMKA